jgi:hypothetical protein
MYYFVLPMVLPNDFNSSEHLQTTLMRVFNPIIREEFSDTSDDIDLNVSRSSLKQACLLNDQDSNVMMLLRLFLFYFGLGKLENVLPLMYSIPIDEIQAVRKFKPQVTLYFKEDLNDVNDGYQPCRSEISFRIMNETSATLTKSELITIANKIKANFGGGTPFIWQRGKTMYTYVDKDNGYQFKLLGRNDTHIKSLITKVLDIRNNVPNWENFKVIETDRELDAYPNIPPTHTVLGKVKRQPRKRPLVDVRFKYAHCDGWGFDKPILLYQSEYIKPDSLVS